MLTEDQLLKLDKIFKEKITPVFKENEGWMYYR